MRSSPSVGRPVVLNVAAASVASRMVPCAGRSLDDSHASLLKRQGRNQAWHWNHSYPWHVHLQKGRKQHLESLEVWFRLVLCSPYLHWYTWLLCWEPQLRIRATGSGCPMQTRRFFSLVPCAPQRMVENKPAGWPRCSLTGKASIHVSTAGDTISKLAAGVHSNITARAHQSETTSLKCP